MIKIIVELFQCFNFDAVYIANNFPYLSSKIDVFKRILLSNVCISYFDINWFIFFNGNFIFNLSISIQLLLRINGAAHMCKCMCLWLIHIFRIFIYFLKLGVKFLFFEYFTNFYYVLVNIFGWNSADNCLPKLWNIKYLVFLYSILINLWLNFLWVL